MCAKEDASRTAADPGLLIRGGGGVACLQKNFFSSFGPQFGLKIKGTAGRAGLPGLTPESATAEMWTLSMHKKILFLSLEDTFRVLSRLAVH